MPNLFPVIDVILSKKTTAVVCICFMSGYSEQDGEGVTIDPAIVFDADGWVTSHAWTDNDAMLAHYKSWLIREIQHERRAAWATTGTADGEGFE